MISGHVRTSVSLDATHNTCIDDSTIRSACNCTWSQAGVTSCEYDDVLQEARVAMWLRCHKMYGKPRAYLWLSAYRAAWRAIRRLCKDELVLGVVNFDGELEAYCYGDGD